MLGPVAATVLVGAVFLTEDLGDIGSAIASYTGFSERGFRVVAIFDADPAKIGLIVGGALGNATDRLRRGAVPDFLDFHLGNWHWPAFNIADMAIVGGAVALVLQTLLSAENSAAANQSR